MITMKWKSRIIKPGFEEYFATHNITNIRKRVDAVAVTQNNSFGDPGGT